MNLTVGRRCCAAGLPSMRRCRRCSSTALPSMGSWTVSMVLVSMVLRPRELPMNLALGARTAMSASCFPWLCADMALRAPGLAGSWSPCAIPQSNPMVRGPRELSMNQATSDPMECGGKRSATPLWLRDWKARPTRKRRRRCALPAHSIEISAWRGSWSVSRSVWHRRLSHEAVR
jgi:hypothetical protein